MVSRPPPRASARLAVGRPRAPQGGRGSLSWPRCPGSARALPSVRESRRPLPLARPAHTVIRTATDADKELVWELWHAFNVEIADAPWRDDDEDEFAPEISFLADDVGLVSLSREGTRHFFVDVLYVR